MPSRPLPTESGSPINRTKPVAPKSSWYRSPTFGGGKKQVSSGGATAPLWSRDGKELYFLSASKQMMAAKIIPGRTINLTNPVALFRVPDDLLVPESKYYTPWDVTRDGRFVMARAVKRAGDEQGATIVVENWIRELKAKVRK